MTIFKSLLCWIAQNLLWLTCCQSTKALNKSFFLLTDGGIRQSIPCGIGRLRFTTAQRMDELLILRRQHFKNHVQPRYELGPRVAFAVLLLVRDHLLLQQRPGSQYSFWVQPYQIEAVGTHDNSPEWLNGNGVGRNRPFLALRVFCATSFSTSFSSPPIINTKTSEIASPISWEIVPLLSRDRRSISHNLSTLLWIGLRLTLSPWLLYTSSD